MTRFRPDGEANAPDFGAFVPGPRLAREGAAQGPLRSLSFAAKDLFDVAGEVTGCGTPDWAESHAPAARTAAAIERLLAAGATLNGKTVTDEISLGLAPVVMDKLYETLALLKQSRMTLIVIEQDVDRALALVDYAYVLEHGAFSLSGPPQEIANPQLRHIYIGAPE